MSTPAHAAAAANDVAALRIALFASPARLDALDHAGWTPLHVAAANNAVIVVRELLRRNAAQNATDSEGRTPLAVARCFCKPDVAALLDPSGPEALRARDEAEREVPSRVEAVLQQRELEVAKRNALEERQLREREETMMQQLARLEAERQRLARVEAELQQREREEAERACRTHDEAERLARLRAMGVPLIADFLNVIRSGILQRVQDMIDRGANINAANEVSAVH